jgi:molybdate transport system substrate-binding protein
LPAIALSVLACGAAVPPSTPLEGGSISVFAAASLTDVVSDLEARWERAHPGVDLTSTFDATNILATQIAEGADADVFLSADASRPAALAREGLTAGQPVPFARSRLTIAVPLEGGLVRTPEDLAEPGVRLVAAGSGVPITRYADEAVARLAATTPDAQAFIDRVAANVVSREDNVRAALAKVELREGDAAIVYEADVHDSRDVREVPFPAGVDVSAEYSAAQISDRPAAAAFIGWLTGPEGAAILAASGFEAMVP